MTSTLLAPDFKATPFWWERTPRPDLGAPEPPSSADVAIVGAGYTGLCAALQVARGGRTTVVLDAKHAGYGCSSRNGGQISTSTKPSLEALSRRHGPQTAFNILKEGHNALAWITQFIAEERIDCDFMVPGRFHGAHNPRQYERMAKALAEQPRGLEVAAHMVPRHEQHRELGTDVYHGGIVFEQHASLDPARFHQGLLERVQNAGAAIVPHCAVTHVARSSRGFTLTTAKGAVQARDVVIATNGYTATLTPWLRRRVIPIGSYIIATEALPTALMDHLMPTQRIISDSRKVVHYYRPSPDRQRILFGGRVTSGETNAERSGVLLHRNLTALFPELANTQIEPALVSRTSDLTDTF